MREVRKGRRDRTTAVEEEEVSGVGTVQVCVCVCGCFIEETWAYFMLRKAMDKSKNEYEEEQWYLVV